MPGHVNPAAPQLDFDEMARVARAALHADGVAFCAVDEHDRGSVEVLGEDWPTSSRPEARPDLVRATQAVIGAYGAASAACAAEVCRVEDSTMSAALVVKGRCAGAMHAVLAPRAGDSREREILLAAFARQTALAREHRGLRRDPATMSAALETSTRLDQLALAAQSYEELTRGFANTLAPLVDAKLAGIMIADDHRGVLQMLPGSFGATAHVAASYQIDKYDARSNAARVFVTRQPYMTNAAKEDPAILQDYVEAFGIKRLVTTPLIFAGRTIGILHIANKPSPFTVEDVGKIEIFAPRVAIAVEHARLLLEIRRREKVEAVLSELAVEIASGGRADRFLVRAMERYGQITDASIVALRMHDGPATVTRHKPVPAELEQAFIKEAGDSGKAVRSALAAPRGAGDPGWSSLHVPVLVSKRRIAGLSVLRQRGLPFTPDETAALARLSDLVALTWTTERYQQERAKMARIFERQRIADDLHDTVAQLLFSGQLTLESLLERDTLDAAERKAITHARGLVASGQTAIREVIDELSERQRADLATRVTLLVRELEREYDINVHLEISPSVAAATRSMRKTIADLLIRVANEAIVNAAKHAAPCRVLLKVDISRDGRLILSAIDDGVGLPAPKNGASSGHGVASLRSAMRSHGGVLRLSRGRHGGTKLTASVPL
jgi:signal transduction histidine kinase